MCHGNLDSLPARSLLMTWAHPAEQCTMHAPPATCTTNPPPPEPDRAVIHSPHTVRVLHSCKVPPRQHGFNLATGSTHLTARLTHQATSKAPTFRSLPRAQIYGQHRITTS